MKLKDWVAITNGIDEFDIYDSHTYYPENKSQMLLAHGEDEIDEIFIETYDDGTWVVATIYLKKLSKNT